MDTSADQQKDRTEQTQQSRRESMCTTKGLGNVTGAMLMLRLHKRFVVIHGKCADCERVNGPEELEGRSRSRDRSRGSRHGFIVCAEEVDFVRGTDATMLTGKKKKKKFGPS